MLIYFNFNIFIRVKFETTVKKKAASHLVETAFFEGG